MEAKICIFAGGDNSFEINILEHSCVKLSDECAAIDAQLRSQHQSYSYLLINFSTSRNKMAFWCKIC